MKQLTMKKLILSFITLCFAAVLCQNAFAQEGRIPHRGCGTMEYLEMQKKVDPGLEARMMEMEDETQRYIEQSKKNPTTQSVVILIPVVFHVVYQNASENIADQRLFDQITALNQDFSKTNSDTNKVPSVWKSIAADCEIQFCLASKDANGNPTNGITRTSTTVTSFSTNNAVKYTAQGGKDIWDRTKFLNIWVCDLGSSLLGYAQFPGGSSATDGVVIHYLYTGTTGSSAPYNKGRTATHEIGHYLNLYHIWGDDGNGQYGQCGDSNPSQCAGSDLVTDTPNECGCNYTCWAAGTVKTDICATTAPGFMWQNYMDYTDDACMYMFTAGQKTRITAAMNGSTRVGLKTSAVTYCAPVGINELSLSDNVSFYPNPSTGDVFISVLSPVNTMDVKVYNAIGETIISKKINALASGETKISMNTHPDGIYLFEVKTEGGTITKKVIINR